MKLDNCLQQVYIIYKFSRFCNNVKNIEQFSIIRQVETTSQGKPVYEMQTYYFVDNTAARQARVRAFKSSIGASETLKKHADKLEEIIKEDVVVE